MTTQPSGERISLIVGLGNPGAQYADTRHNVGFWLVEELARRAGVQLRREARFQGFTGRVSLGDGECWLFEPATFMNHSGRAVGAFVNFYRIALGGVLIAHDDLDLLPGTVRLKRGGGHGGHNGLRDIMAVSGSRDFARVRIGIGHPGDRDRVVSYVLNRPSRGEEAAIREAIDNTCDQMPEIVGGGLQKAMNVLHAARS